MDRAILYAGAAQRVITPPVSMSGWNPRASGDIRSRYVHDDLYVKALVLRNGNRAWTLVAVDLSGVDAVATEQIRQGAAQRTGLEPGAIMVCATHTHSGPAFCPVATAYSPEDMARLTIGETDRRRPPWVRSPRSRRLPAGWARRTWRGRPGLSRRRLMPWMRPMARCVRPPWGSVEARIDGVASSRRVLMSDGSWGDPRREPAGGARVVSRTSIDPQVRVIAVREQGTRTPLAAVINYGTHPWIFCGSGISAEIAGAAAGQVADAWAGSEEESPVVLYTSGPEGDVTTIWNVDIEAVWRTRPYEDAEASLSRRERGFGRGTGAPGRARGGWIDDGDPRNYGLG